MIAFYQKQMKSWDDMVPGKRPSEPRAVRGVARFSLSSNNDSRLAIANAWDNRIQKIDLEFPLSGRRFVHFVDHETATDDEYRALNQVADEWVDEARIVCLQKKAEVERKLGIFWEKSAKLDRKIDKVCKQGKKERAEIRKCLQESKDRPKPSAANSSLKMKNCNDFIGLIVAVVCYAAMFIVCCGKKCELSCRSSPKSAIKV